MKKHICRNFFSVLLSLLLSLLWGCGNKSIPVTTVENNSIHISSPSKQGSASDVSALEEGVNSDDFNPTKTPTENSPSGLEGRENSDDNSPTERSINISSAQELLFFSPCSEETGVYYKMRVISDVQVIADYFNALHTASWQDPQGWEVASLDKEMVIILEKDKTHFFGYQGEMDSYGNAYIRYCCQDGALHVSEQDQFTDSELRNWISEQFKGEVEEFILVPTDYRNSLAVLTEAL